MVYMEIIVIIVLALALTTGALLAKSLISREKEKAGLQAGFAAEKEQLRKDMEAEKELLRKDMDAEKALLLQNLSQEQRRSAALQSQLQAREEVQKQIEERYRKELQAKDEIQRTFEEQHRKELAQMKEVFQNLSNSTSEAFQAKSKDAISELLKPVTEKFNEFSAAVRDSQKDSADRHARLEQKIIDLEGRSQSVGDEARNLANALTGYSKVQGDFGEMLLTDVLKNAGLVEGIHFRTQSVITDAAGREVKSDEGHTMIPDVTVFYPDDTSVIIDSKVSLRAYSEYMAATTVEDRSRLAKAHVESVRSHVEELRGKDYASYIDEGRRKVDFNIMFIPIEGAFRLMLEADPLLWQQAKDNNVLIVSQMTLVIVLNMIRMSWKQHEQEKNIADVYKTAEELMSQLRNWMESFVRTGDYLTKAADAYADARKKLVDSPQSVVKKIGKLESLGLAPKRSAAKLKPGSRKASEGSIIPSTLDFGGAGEAESDDASDAGA